MYNLINVLSSGCTSSQHSLQSEMFLKMIPQFLRMEQAKTKKQLEALDLGPDQDQKLGVSIGCDQMREFIFYIERKNYVWLFGDEKINFVIILVPKNVVYEFLKKFVHPDKLNVSF